MSECIENHKVIRLWGYPNMNTKDYSKADRTYGLTTLKIDAERHWLFVHNSTLNQIDIIDTIKNQHLKTFDYLKICSSLNVHKGMEVCSKRGWLLIAGYNCWLIWDYKDERIVQLKEFETETNIASIQISPNEKELWILFQDKEIAIYSLDNWEKLDAIKISGSYSLPLIWHPNGEHFLFTRMEQGGSEIYIGNIENRTINWDKSASSSSYIIANLAFSACGNYILYTDAGFHLCKFPSLEGVYSLDKYTKKVAHWKSPQYPKAYQLVLPFSKESKFKDHMLLIAGRSRQMMTMMSIKDSQEVIRFLPLALEDYVTKIEGFISGGREGCFYFSDYLGGIYSLDILENLEKEFLHRGEIVDQ